MQTAECIEQYFQTAALSMRELPVFNARLHVELRDWRQIEGLGGLALLITPWCMNLLWLPDEAQVQDWPSKGSKVLLPLPSGDYECVAHLCPVLGHYASASLCSPMGHFESQEEAQGMADEVLRLLYTQEEIASTRPEPTGVTRRGLFRRVLGQEGS